MASQETTEINEQYFLPEILDEIFQNLNVQDLSKVATINKLWNEVAAREQTKRGLERTVISITDTKVYESLSTKPNVTLMFVALKVIQYGVKTLQFDVLKKYKDYFPNYLVTVGLHYVIMDQEFIEMSEGGIFSLLIPEYRDLKVRAAYTQDLDSIANLKDFFNEFFPEDLTSKATFIIFGQSTFNNSGFFESLKKSMEERQQKYSMWGASFNNALFAAVDGQIDKNVIEESEQFCDHLEYNGMFAMSITGSSLRSSSIVISGLTKKHEFHQKLLDFRNQLQLKRQSIGLACGPEDVDDYSAIDLADVYVSFPEMLHVVKRIFLGVPFIGIYDKCCLDSYYGFKSTNEDPKQEFQHQMSLTLRILTYD